MSTSQWSLTESLMLAFNVVVIGLIIWALRRRIRTKLNEVEARQNQSLMRQKNPDDDTSEQ
jgi:hypothetical protein